jgi:transcriptional regulator with XRE-family HTH domain
VVRELRRRVLVTDVSTRLRTARQQAGLAIEDVSAKTKINPVLLRALERGEFDRLPGDFYTRAFLKLYARELRLPADEIVHEYDASRPETPAAAATADAVDADDVPRGPQPWARLMSWRPNLPALPAVRALPDLRGLPALSTLRSAGPVLAVAAILLIAIAMSHRPVHPPAAEQGAVGTTGVVPAVQTPSPVPAPQAAPEKLVIDIRPAGVMWVAATADGKRIIYRLLQPGEHVSVEGRNALEFRIGNAGAFGYAINGVPGKVLGGADQVREFRITRDNYRTFLR